MISMLLGLALAGPVVLDQPEDPFDRCIREAENAAAEFERAPMPDGLVDRLAIVVGVPCHRSSAIPALAWSTRDAVRMGTTLQSAGYAVEFLVSDVELATVEQALDAATERVTPDGTVLVYFSGHGVLEDRDGRVRRHLVFTDTTLDRLGETSMAAADLESRLANLPVRDTVLIQDTCYAATQEQGAKSIFRPRPGSKQLALPDQPAAAQQGEQRLYASQFFEQALELPELQGSVYTHHLLRAMQDDAADLDGDGCVGTLEAHIAATAGTEADLHGQHPQLSAGSPRNLPLGCSGDPSHAVVLDEGARVESPDGAAGVGPIAVAPGRHTIEVQDSSGRNYRGKVALKAGEWLDAKSVADARRSYATVGVHGGLGDLGSGPTRAFGVSGWHVAADHGTGRIALGGSMLAIPRVRAIDKCTRFSGGQALGRAGLFFGPRTAAVGPVVEGGVSWREPYDACTGEGQFDRYPGSMGGLGLHGHLGKQFVLVTADVGVRAFPAIRNDRTHIEPGLSAAIGVSFKP